MDDKNGRLENTHLGKSKKKHYLPISPPIFIHLTIFRILDLKAFFLAETAAQEVGQIRSDDVWYW
jgi:hypothetical protein